MFGTEDHYVVYCLPFRRRTWFTVQRACLRRWHCRLFRRSRLRILTSAATQTAIIASGFTATTTGTDVGGSLNTARIQFTAAQVGGCAMPMATGVILNTLAGRGTRTGSTVTRTTATDNGSPSAFSIVGTGRRTRLCWVKRSVTSSCNGGRKLAGPRHRYSALKSDRCGGRAGVRGTDAHVRR
jgi:hypothetical protein